MCIIIIIIIISADLPAGRLAERPGPSLWGELIRPISLLTLSPLTLLDSSFTEISLWTWEFHPFKLRLCLSQTL